MPKPEAPKSELVQAEERIAEKQKDKQKKTDKNVALTEYLETENIDFN